MAAARLSLANGSSGARSPESFAVLAVRGVAGILVAVRRFGWSPRDV